MVWLWKAVALYLLLVNFVAFFLYGADKRKAKKNQWRTPERVLLGIAVAGGGVGALAGMKVFHHKTKHRAFQILVPLSIVLWAVLLALAVGKLA